MSRIKEGLQACSKVTKLSKAKEFHLQGRILTHKINSK